MRDLPPTLETGIVTSGVLGDDDADASTWGALVTRDGTSPTCLLRLPSRVPRRIFIGRVHSWREQGDEPRDLPLIDLVLPICAPTSPADILASLSSWPLRFGVLEIPHQACDRFETRQAEPASCRHLVRLAAAVLDAYDAGIEPRRTPNFRTLRVQCDWACVQGRPKQWAALAEACETRGLAFERTYGLHIGWARL